MHAKDRRIAICTLLHTATEAFTSTTLAQRFGVSRQVIVGDIAILRAGGENIISTPHGYMMDQMPSEQQFLIACQHGDSQLKEELYTIVDLGGHILNVMIEHPIYGQLVGSLQLRSRYDVDRFCDQLYHTKSLPLSLLTEGVHLHTLSCPDQETFNRIIESLRQSKILYE